MVTNGTESQQGLAMADVFGHLVSVPASLTFLSLESINLPSPDSHLWIAGKEWLPEA
jgi:hypothetical protein